MARMPPGWPGRHVLLCIDEAQQMSSHVAGSCAPGFYSDLHAFGTPRGFLVAAFGLGDTEAALDRLGVPRSGSAPGTEGHRWRTVGTMPERDVRMAVRRCFRACGVRRDTEAQVWEDAVVRASNGWAQHTAPLSGLRRPGGARRRRRLPPRRPGGHAGSRGRGADRVLQEADRRIGVRTRVAPGRSRRTSRVAAAYRAGRPWPPSCRPICARKACPEITKEAIDQCLTAAVHAGLLENDGGAWRIPILSFQAHLRHHAQPTHAQPDRRAEVGAAAESPPGCLEPRRSAQLSQVFRTRFPACRYEAATGRWRPAGSRQGRGAVHVSLV